MGAPHAVFVAKINLTIGVARGYVCDTELLEQQIHTADQEEPWASKYLGGDPAPSIGSIDRITRGELSDCSKYQTTIWPSMMVTLSQVHAYYAYANRLAINLAKNLREQNEIWFVGATIELESQQNSYDPRAI